MSMMLEYKGYYGSVEYSAEDEVLHGRLEFIGDLVTYEAPDAKGLKAAFEEAVDDYLDLCQSEGRKPDVPLKGSFNIRPGRDLHRRAMLYAKRRGMNLNEVVTHSLTSYLDREESGGAARPRMRRRTGS
jgi:predicted HicB family RNase H-like nuclease